MFDFMPEVFYFFIFFIFLEVGLTKLPHFKCHLFSHSEAFDLLKKTKDIIVISKCLPSYHICIFLRRKNVSTFSIIYFICNATICFLFITYYFKKCLLCFWQTFSWQCLKNLPWWIMPTPSRQCEGKSRETLDVLHLM